MTTFEYWEEKIRELCKNKDVAYQWTHNYITREYHFMFKKNNIIYALTLTERDIVEEPLYKIKEKIEKVMQTLLDYTE